MNKLGVKEIEQILPHRHPFLLVDYIEDYEPGKYAVGYKCVTFREYWKFTGDNATHLEKELDVAVPSGTYYRVRGYHAASNGGLKESTSTLTSGIMVK